jgi:peroxiredoxin
MPNIRRNYEEFKDKGFEVVGVNMNTDPQELERFFALQELPWPTVVSQEVLDKQEFPMWNDLPMAKKYGVDAIPFVVLVNKEGKVDSLHLRGPKLTARLTELFGDAKPAPTGE